MTYDDNEKYNTTATVICLCISIVLHSTQDPTICQQFSCRNRRLVRGGLSGAVLPVKAAVEPRVKRTGTLIYCPLREWTVLFVRGPGDCRSRVPGMPWQRCNRDILPLWACRESGLVFAVTIRSFGAIAGRGALEKVEKGSAFFGRRTVGVGFDFIGQKNGAGGERAGLIYIWC